MNFDPETLNAALCEYVKTFPNRSRLNSFLNQRRWDDHTAGITEALDLTIRTAEDFLYDYPGGVPWTVEFDNQFSETLRRTSPWLDEEGVKTMRAFAG